jgi:predicted ATPase/class 3 adenylate cyclase
VTTADLPVGTVTFLFTDLEDSSRLLASETRGTYDDILATHRQLLTDAVHRHGGYVAEGQADSFFAVFETASSALETAVEAQRECLHHEWPGGPHVRVRMGLHSGEVKVVGERYAGMEVHRAARIGDAGHGGQIVLSDAARFLLGDSLPSGIGLIDLGEHKLKDLPRPEHIHQVTADGLPVDFPALRSAEELGTRERIVAALSHFIGRESEKKEIRRLLEDPAVRLVTLTGPGGTGKTRLALEVAVDIQDELEDEVVFVPLAQVSSASTVVSAILQAAHVREVAGRDPLETLKRSIHDRRMLLVLDNFEHVMEAADKLPELLDASENLRLLVTSREVLRLSAEREYQVPPLTVPRSTVSVEAITSSEAVQLFGDRAKSVDRSFEVTRENAADIATICALLDGLPLAIELAAARVRILPPGALRSRLEQDFNLLVGGSRDLPERQQTIRNAIDWSYRLLEDDEKALFESLGVFAGGWNLDAMSAVCSDIGEGEIFESLASLVDKSLVYRRDDEGETRFAMLRSIRDFALQQLEASGGADARREAHAEFFLDYAQRAGPELRSDRQQSWIIGLNADIDNVRAAMRWSLDKANCTRAAEIGWGVWPYWWILSRFNEGMSWMQEVVNGGELGDDARGKALVVQGILAFGGGHYDVGAVALQQGVELCRSTNNGMGVGLALGFLGVVTSLGDTDAAWDLLYQAHDKFVAVGDEWGTYFSLFSLGWVRVAQGRHREAMKLLEASLHGMRRVGEKVSIAFIHITIGLTHLALKEAPQAESVFLEALRLLSEVKDTVGTARALEGLAGAALLGGDAERAAVLFGAAEGARRNVDADVWLLDTYVHQEIESDIRKALGDEKYASLFEEGTALAPEEVQPLATAAGFHGA